MMKKSKTIVFFGTDEFSLTALEQLFNAGYKIIAVVTKPDSKSGRGQKISFSAVKKFALEKNIPVWQPAKISEITDKIKALEAVPVGVLVSYGKIIPESVINLFEPAIINVHPSLLPRYRGPTPIESAIKNGDKQTGVSIMQLTPQMDAGAIYNQTIYSLNNTETSPELYKILANVGAAKLIEILPAIMNGGLEPIPQQNNKATYCNLLDKKDAWLDFEKVTAVSAERIIRSHLTFPKTKVNINGQPIIITKAHVTDKPKTILDIECKENSHLAIDELITKSGRKISAKDFLNGYRLG